MVRWHKIERMSRSQGTVIIWSPKMLHKAAIEFLTVWTVELSCGKKLIPSLNHLNSQKVVQEFVPHTFLDLLFLNILV
jgi:hypothetical protein